MNSPTNFRLPGIWLSLMLLWPTVRTSAQQHITDSLETRLKSHPRSDTGRVNLLNALSKAVRNSNPARQLQLAQQALTLADRLNYGSGQAQAYLHLSSNSIINNDYKQASIYAREAQQLYIRLNDQVGQVNCLTQLANINLDQGNYAQSVAFVQRALTMVEPLKNTSTKAHVNILLAQNYIRLDNYPKARQYTAIGLRIAKAVHDEGEQSRAFNLMAIIANRQGKLAEARYYFEQSLVLSDKLEQPLHSATIEGNIVGISERQGNYADAFRYGRRALLYFQRIKATRYLTWIEAVLAKTHLHTGHLDSAIIYGRRSLQAADAGGLRDISSEVAEVLAKAYARQGQYVNAYHYQVRYMALKDSLKGEETIRRTTAMQYSYELDKQQSQIALLTRNQKIDADRDLAQRRLFYASLVGLALLLTLAVVLFRNNRAEYLANDQLQQQKQALENTLTELRTAQRQLVQAEKMETMVELTKGIVDRILNPLNYINNFSQGAKDLLQELLTVTQKHQATFSPDDQGILEDTSRMMVKNLEKINEHGNSTARILKDMQKLFKERSTTLVTTNIHSLLEQQITTSLQAVLEDNSPALPVELVFDLSSQSLEVSLLPHEFRQVLTSLVDNSCYALLEKSRHVTGFVPKIEVYTKVVDDQIHIHFQDNGHGIDAKEMTQLFSPFFTTKPTAKGTGLGLYMGRDLVEHLQGQMSVDSVKGEFTRTTIVLPLVQVESLV